MSAEEEKQVTQTERYTWEQAWALVGFAPDEMISCTQAQLVHEAYNLENTAEQALAEGTLTEVEVTGAEVNGDTFEVRAGYRLAGRPSNPRGAST